MAWVCGMQLWVPLKQWISAASDIFNHVGSYMFDSLCNDGGVPPILKRAYEEGKYGLKNGKGFYDYSGDKAEKMHSSTVTRASSLWHTP